MEAAVCAGRVLAAGADPDSIVGLLKSTMAVPAPSTIITAAATTDSAKRRLFLGGVRLGKRVETTPRLVAASPWR